VALWPTSLVALVLLVAGGCGQASERSAGTGTVPAPVKTRPTMTPTSQQPLTVAGSGFHPGEHVRVSTDAPHAETVETDADDAGAFKVTLHFDACGSINVTAVGSKGSRTQFNLSQIACAGT
jgi:hypothetical protein